MLIRGCLLYFSFIHLCFSLLVFFPVSFIFSAHCSAFRWETQRRVWICFFLETSGHICIRDRLTFSTSFLCSCVSFSFSLWTWCRYMCMVQHRKVCSCYASVMAHEPRFLAWFVKSYLCFSFLLEFKRQLSTLDEEDNQCTAPTGKHQVSIQWGKAYSTDCMANSLNSMLLASNPGGPASQRSEQVRASEKKRDTAFGLDAAKASAG